MITTLSQLTALVESNNDASAIRFEPNWRYITPALIDICKRSHSAYMNDATAKCIMSCSYGKYQIMGSILYELGYRGKLSDFAVNSTLQDAWYETYCQKRNIAYTLDEVISDPAKRADYSKKYNGDAVTYGAKLLSTFKTINGGA